MKHEMNLVNFLASRAAGETIDLSEIFPTADFDEIATHLAEYLMGIAIASWANGLEWQGVEEWDEKLVQGLPPAFVKMVDSLRLPNEAAVLSGSLRPGRALDMLADSAIESYGGLINRGFGQVPLP